MGGFGGDACSEPRCPHSCGGHGLCHPDGPGGSGVCRCDEDYGGSDCGTFVVFYPSILFVLLIFHSTFNKLLTTCYVIAVLLLFFFFCFCFSCFIFLFFLVLQAQKFVEHLSASMATAWQMDASVVLDGLVMHATYKNVPKIHEEGHAPHMVCVSTAPACAKKGLVVMCVRPIRSGCVPTTVAYMVTVLLLDVIVLLDIEVSVAISSYVHQTVQIMACACMVRARVTKVGPVQDAHNPHVGIIVRDMAHALVRNSVSVPLHGLVMTAVKVYVVIHVMQSTAYAMLIKHVNVDLDMVVRTVPVKLTTL